MKKIKVAIIGSGGHAKSCIDVIENIKTIKIIGIIDNKKKAGIGSNKVICDDKNILKIKNFTNNLVLGVGGLNDPSLRQKIYKKFKNLGFKFPALISNHSLVSKNAKIGEGTLVFNHVYINSGVVIGQNCIINNKCLIEHDTIVGDHSHISTGAIINGNCSIGSGSFIGSGSIILNNIKLKDNSFVKMGTIQKKNI